ncbi:MAG: hypothetical protein OHK0039_15490 [Bacteroidia bacterium]
MAGRLPDAAACIDLYRLLRERASQRGIYVDVINGSTDHVHVLLRLGPAQTLAQVVRSLQEMVQQALAAEGYPPLVWAAGYLAASVSPEQVPMLRRHIRRQTWVHARYSLEQERWELRLQAHDDQCVVVGVVQGGDADGQLLRSA